MRDVWTIYESLERKENTMYDIVTAQRLAQIRQQEMIAQAQQYARNRKAGREKPVRNIHSVPVLAQLLVMLGR
jgi:hypothetical protein